MLIYDKIARKNHVVKHRMEEKYILKRGWLDDKSSDRIYFGGVRKD